VPAKFRFVHAPVQRSFRPQFFLPAAGMVLPSPDIYSKYIIFVS